MNNKEKIQEKKDNKFNYLEGLKEWQEHLYNPWYYIGRKIPHFITNPGKPALFGLALIMCALTYGACWTFIVIPYLGLDNLVGIIVSSIFIYGVISLQLIGGIRQIKKSRIKAENSINRSKTYSISIGLLICVFIISVSIYKYNEEESEMTITSANQYSVEQVNYKDFVYLKEEDITLKCSSEDYSKLWIKKIFKDEEKYKNKTFILKYKWNKLSPKKGKLIKLVKEQNN